MGTLKTGLHHYNFVCNVGLLMHITALLAGCLTLCRQ